MKSLFNHYLVFLCNKIQNQYMKQLAIQSDRAQKPQVSSRNRVRLMQQNKRLLLEIYKLEQIISTIIEKDANNQFGMVQQTNQAKRKYRSQLDQQLKFIVKLKNDIKRIKANIAQHKYNQVKKQQNQITYLKRQYEKLASERDTLTKKKNQKDYALQFHKPINNQTAQTQQQYKKIKAQNGDLRLKIHQIERQVGKYHKYKELAKTSVPKQYDNPEYQFIRIQNEVKSMKKEMRRIEQKWKAKIQSLDRQYFGFKSILADKQTQILQLQRQAKNWENRMTAQRDSMDIANDRQRVSGIVISPQKRKEMQNLLDQQKKKLKRLQPKLVDFKQKSQKNKKQILKQPLTSTPQPVLIIQEAIEPKQVEQQPIIKPENKVQVQEPSQRGAKPKKMVESVGVGTSFYYSDE